MDYNQSLQSDRRQRRLYFLLVGLMTFIAFGGGVLYTIFFTDMFNFNEIIITGDTILTREELFARPPYLFSRIDISHPLVASFLVTKNFFNKKLILNIKDREPYGIWCSESQVQPISTENCFWFDEGGFLFSSAPATLGALVKGIYEENGRDLALGSYVLPDQSLKRMFSIFKVLKAAEVYAIKFTLPDLGSQEIQAETLEGTRLYFSLRVDPAFTLEALQSLRLKLGELSYIDFRSENRVFYK